MRSNHGRAIRRMGSVMPENQSSIRGSRWTASGKRNRSSTPLPWWSGPQEFVDAGLGARAGIDLLDDDGAVERGRPVLIRHVLRAWPRAGDDHGVGWDFAVER